MANDAISKFKSSINRGITTINVKTSSSLEKTKIKTHIESLRTEIGKLFSSIGERAYAVWESQSGADDDRLLEMYALVKQKKDEIESLTAELNSIDERDNQILGTMKQEAADAAGRKIVCPQCGSQYDEPAKFCRKCGQKLQ